MHTQQKPGADATTHCPQSRLDAAASWKGEEVTARPLEGAVGTVTQYIRQATWIH